MREERKDVGRGQAWCTAKQNWIAFCVRQNFRYTQCFAQHKSLTAGKEKELCTGEGEVYNMYIHREEEEI